MIMINISTHMFVDNQWLQFDIGPPTLITGLMTKGRGESGKRQWVSRFRISHSNDTTIWYFYKDAANQEIKVYLFLFQLYM